MEYRVTGINNILRKDKYMYTATQIIFIFFFFKQKTAYEMSASLVGSEMCIRDRTTGVSLYSPGYPGAHFVDQAGLELRNPPASATP